jgi:AP-1 complex subunit gamma-1
VPRRYVVGQALCALGNIGTSDMTRDLAPEVERLLGSQNPYVRKKAALCAVRVLRRNPDMAENFAERLRGLLNDRNHGVLLCGVTAILGAVMERSVGGWTLGCH